MARLNIDESLILEQALNARNAVISITGPTAGETEAEMLQRKLRELDAAGRIFWGIRSYTCHVPDVLDLVAANGSEATYVLFFAGGRPTENKGTFARYYSTARLRPSENSPEWQPIPSGICVKNVARSSTALVLGGYAVVTPPIRVDFSQYTFFDSRHLRIKPGPKQAVASLTHQGRSTVCAKKGSHGALRSPHQLVGVGWLACERAVWVRA